MTPDNLRRTARHIAEVMRGKDVEDLCQWVLDQTHHGWVKPVTHEALIQLGGVPGFWIKTAVEFPGVTFNFDFDDGSLVSVSVYSNDDGNDTEVMLPRAMFPRHMRDVHEMLERYPLPKLIRNIWTTAMLLRGKHVEWLQPTDDPRGYGLLKQHTAQSAQLHDVHGTHAMVVNNETGNHEFVELSNMISLKEKTHGT